MSEQELHISKIESGTVIDHISAGQALNVLALLGIVGTTGEVVSVAMNVPSGRMGKKDVVKVESRELSQHELDVLSIIAPDATINIIRDYAVVEKNRVERPSRVIGVVQCPNLDCITNTDEPVTSNFTVLEDGVRCEYCGTIVKEDITSYLAI